MLDHGDETRTNGETRPSRCDAFSFLRVNAAERMATDGNVCVHDVRRATCDVRIPPPCFLVLPPIEVY